MTGSKIWLLLPAMLIGAGRTDAPAEDEIKSPRPILFVSDRGADSRVQIYRMDPDGRNVVALTSGEGLAFDPAWSPDGKEIVFCSWASSKNASRAAVETMRAGPPCGCPPTWPRAHGGHPTARRSSFPCSRRNGSRPVSTSSRGMATRWSVSARERRHGGVRMDGRSCGVPGRSPVRFP